MPPSDLPDPGGAARALGIELQEASRERAIASIDIGERHLGPDGALDGGVLISLSWAAARAGACFNRSPSRATRPSGLDARHPRPARAGQTLTATATPLYVGLDRQLWEVEVRDEGGSLVCACRCDFGPEPGQTR